MRASPTAINAWPPPAPATCSRASSARSWPAGMAAFDAAAAAAWLHGRGRRRCAGQRARRQRRLPDDPAGRRGVLSLTTMSTDSPTVGLGRGRPRRHRRTTSGCCASAVAPAEVWAVVKADGYGHGAVAGRPGGRWPPAPRPLRRPRSEGVALRHAGIAAPILVLSEQPADELPTARRPRPHRHRRHDRGHRRARRGGAGGHARRIGVHVKVDTGMHRVGAAPDDARGPRRRRSREAPALAPRRRVHPPRRRRRAERPLHRRAVATLRRPSSPASPTSTA